MLMMVTPTNGNADLERTVARARPLVMSARHAHRLTAGTMIDDPQQVTGVQGSALRYDACTLSGVRTKTPREIGFAHPHEWLKPQFL